MSKRYCKEELFFGMHKVVITKDFEFLLLINYSNRKQRYLPKRSSFDATIIDLFAFGGVTISMPKKWRPKKLQEACNSSNS